MKKTAEAIIAIHTDPNEQVARHSSLMIRAVALEQNNVKYFHIGGNREAQIDPEIAQKISLLIATTSIKCREAINKTTEARQAEGHINTDCTTNKCQGNRSGVCKEKANRTKNQAAVAVKHTMEQAKKMERINGTTIEIEKITVVEASEPDRRARQELTIEVSSAGAITKFQIRDVTQGWIV